MTSKSKQPITKKTVKTVSAKKTSALTSSSVTKKTSASPASKALSSKPKASRPSKQVKTKPGIKTAAASKLSANTVSKSKHTASPNAVKSPAKANAKAVVKPLLKMEPKPAAKSKAPQKQKLRVADRLPAPPASLTKPAERLTKSPLSKEDLKYFEKMLIQKRSEVLRDLEIMRSMLEESNSEDSNSSYSMHMADHGTETMDKEQHFMFIQRDEKYLGYIDKALERIKNGTYGICAVSGLPIPRERLEAVPHTAVRIEYKSKR